MLRSTSLQFYHIQLYLTGNLKAERKENAKCIRLHEKNIKNPVDKGEKQAYTPSCLKQITPYRSADTTDIYKGKPMKNHRAEYTGKRSV